jgi:hypothetical protein
MARILRRENIEDVIIGATFLGSGGGGSPREGYELIERLEKEVGEIKVKLVDPEEMKELEYAVMVAGIGAPRAFKEKKFGAEAIHAFELIQRISFLGGKEISYLMAGELGGFNTIVPMYVAIAKEIPFVDGDGNRRAVPELSTGLYPSYNIPPHPLVLANDRGDSVVAYLGDPFDHRAAETIARQLSVAWGMLAAFSTWIVNKHQILSCLAPRTITRSEEIGRVFRKVGEAEDLSKELSKLGSKEIFVGTIKKLETRTEGGFDFGRTTIDGEGEYSGRVMTIDFKNENIIAKIDGEIVAMVPDLISIVNLEDMKPVTNADTAEGQRIAVYGTQAPENWKKVPEGFNCWRHILGKLGYSGDYIPLK